MRKIRTGICIFIVFAIVTGGGLNIFAKTNALDEVLCNTAGYVYNTIQNPQFGSVGGEWAIAGLARSGCDIPLEYYENYYRTLESYVKSREGILHEKKYTENARVAVALTAIGKNPENVAGYNLLAPFGDYDKIVSQGVNGPIWALIALDCGNYDMPQVTDAKTQATREMYVSFLLETQLPDGGWSLVNSGNSEADITAMVIQALSAYQDTDTVRAATNKALECMSEMQGENGGFSEWGADNIESAAQMIIALCELGISPEDERFVKNGKTLIYHMLEYRQDSGFKHSLSDEQPNQMATEQALCAMTAAKRQSEGRNGLYDMSDVKIAEDNASNQIGLPKKHPDISLHGITKPEKTFADITNHSARRAIEALSAREIINGKSADSFEPDSTMTRAEFAAIAVRSLGLSLTEKAIFADVTEDDWFYCYVSTAKAYGIVSGVSETEFNPHGTITREEAAVMTARAAKLCGMDTEAEYAYARDILAGFTDYVKVSDWAVKSLAFCYDKRIIADDEIEIKPGQAVERAQVAQMLYNMLKGAELLNE